MVLELDEVVVKTRYLVRVRTAQCNLYSLLPSTFIVRMKQAILRR